MTLEIKQIKYNNADYYLTKTTTQKQCQDIVKRPQKSYGYFNPERYCDVDILELKKINSDGTTKTVQRKTVEKLITDLRRKISQDNRVNELGDYIYVKKRITRENLETGEKSIISDIQTPYGTPALKSIKLNAPDVVDIDCAKNLHAEQLEEVKTINVNLKDMGALKKLSNSGRRLIRNIFKML